MKFLLLTRVRHHKKLPTPYLLSSLQGISGLQRSDGCRCFMISRARDMLTVVKSKVMTDFLILT